MAILRHKNCGTVTGTFEVDFEIYFFGVKLGGMVMGVDFGFRRKW